MTLHIVPSFDLTQVLKSFHLISVLPDTSLTLPSVSSFDLTRVLVSSHLTSALPDISVMLLLDECLWSGSAVSL